MKKSFTKFLLLAIVAMVSGNAWADGISPAADYSYRLNWNTSKSEMNFTYKTSHDQQAQYEIKWTTQLFALQQYNIENFKYAKTLTLNIAKTTTGNTTSMAVWDFGTNTLPTTGTTPESRIEFLKTVQGITGTWFYQTETPSSDNYAATTATTWGNKALATATYKSESSAFVATIDASKLTNVTMSGTTGKVRFLITTNTPNAGTAAKYDAGSTLTVTNWAVYNETQSNGYDNLASAVSAANENDVIKVLSDQTLTARLDITKAITIDGNDKTITINQKTASGFLIKAGATIKNATIAGADGGKAVFEFANSTDKTNFAPTIENVTVNNANVANQGVYRIKDYAQVTLKNVVNSDITVTDGYAEIFLAEKAQTTACNLRGTCSVASAYLEKGKRLDVSGATISSPIQLAFISTYANNYVCIQHLGEVSDFYLYDNTKVLYQSKWTSGQEELSVSSSQYILTVSSAGAATLVLPFDVTIPDGVSVYTLTYTSGDKATAKAVTGTLSKNTPVCVIAAAGNYTFPIVENTTAEAEANPTSGALTGVYSKTTVPGGSYILYKGDEGVGFYRSNSSTVAPYRCYLTAEGSGAKAITIEFEDVTGINDLTQTISQGEGAAYNLAGQRVSTNAKGIVIINGRKFINK